VGKHTYRWWDGDVYRQATFTTKADKADFVTEVRRRRRLGLSLSFEPEEHDPRLDEFIEDYWRLHAIPHSGTLRAARTSRSGSSGSCRGWAPTGCGSCPPG
jgi:hypothetical protein